jgi:hypothetical protein
MKPTNNEQVLDHGTHVRYRDYQARIHDQGVCYRVEFQNGHEEYVSKKKHGSPPNLRNVMQEVVEKR